MLLAKLREQRPFGARVTHSQSLRPCALENHVAINPRLSDIGISETIFAIRINGSGYGSAPPRAGAQY